MSYHETDLDDIYQDMPSNEAIEEKLDKIIELLDKLVIQLVDVEER